MAENGVHKPRLCKVVKGENGYGFHLHGEKGKVGQRIRKIDENGAADNAGLLVGDRIVAVNGYNVEKENHQEVVRRIKERDSDVELLVIDEESEKIFMEKGIPLTSELSVNGDEEQSNESEKKSVTEATTEETTVAEKVAETTNGNSSGELRPRLCKLTKDSGGYGFNLHSEKGKPGRYIRAVDPGTPAEAAGVKGGDRIIEVNGVNMEFEKHAKLVTAIKESGNSVSLLLVDDETDKFFQSCEVTPTESHLTGPLPTPKPKKEEEEKPQELDFISMDLTMLKEKSRSRKKRAPASDWENRRAMFNNL